MKIIDETQLKQRYEANARVVDIAEEFGVHPVTIMKRIRKMGLTRTRLPLVEDLTGQKFGRLTTIRYERLDAFGKAMWLTRCDCGKEKVLNASAMKAGLTTSCGCIKRQRARKGAGNLSRAYWHKVEKAALQRDLVFSITPEWALKKLEEQKGLCALSGVPIALFPNNEKYRLQTASLDRIDSTKGYTTDNVQWVHKRVNFLKRDYTEEELIFWATKIAEHRQSQYRDITNHIPTERRPLDANTTTHQTA